MRPDSKDRRIQKLEIILDVAKALSTERDLGVLLELIVEHARDVVGADRGSIFLLDKDKNELWSKVAQGAKEIGDLRVEVGELVAGLKECAQVGRVAALVGYWYVHVGGGGERRCGVQWRRGSGLRVCWSNGALVRAFGERHIGTAKIRQ